MTDVLSNLAPDTPVEPGANYIAGDNIKIEDNTISAVGYRYDEEKNSVSIGGGEAIVTLENDGVSEDIVIEGKTQAVGKNSFASGFNSIAFGKGSHAEVSGNTKIVNFEVHKMTQELADALNNDPQFSGTLEVENTYYSTDESIIGSSSGFTGLFLYNNESQSIGGYIGTSTMSRNTTYNDETIFVFQLSGSIGIEDGQYISWLSSDGIASGDASHAEGTNATASGDASHAEGTNATASGYVSHSEGEGTTASGMASHSEGTSTTASGMASHSEGSGTIASGDASHAEGASTTASGLASHSEGSGTIASGRASHAEGNPGSMNTFQQQEQQYEWDEQGNQNINYVDNYNWEEGTNIINFVNLSVYDFKVGETIIIEKYDEYDNLIDGPINTKITNIDYENNQIEIDTYLYFNAQYTQLVLIKYAAIGDYSHREGCNTTASGSCSHSEGCSGTIASGYAAHAEGEGTTASGMNSHTEGRATIAYGLASHAGGYNSQANGDYSFVHGYNCTVHTSGENAHTIGRDNYISDSGCIALGKGLTSHREYCTYLGQYNKQLPGDWNDIIAVVGDGTDSSNQRNIVVIQSGNEPAVHCRGAFKNDATWINDFGEYFEWADGNPNNEDRVGYMVQLNDEKIELAQSYEKCIGVVSATAGFIGGACSFDWHGIYLRDEFGRYILDENGNPMVNPEYDESKEYLPRSKRPEWSIIGILGQVITRQDGTLISGGFASCINGIATNADSGYSVLKVLSDKTALLLIK